MSKPMPTEWKPATDLCGIQCGQPLTFNMHHQDIKQGSLSNCWLIAAISSVAEYAHAGDNNADIQSIFLTHHYKQGSPVQIQLYDKEGNRRVVNVPDKFPTVDGSKPWAACPKASEDAWVMFLEAAAGMVKSGCYDSLTLDCYKALDGNSTLQEGFTYLLGPQQFLEVSRHGDSWVRGDEEVSLEELWQGLVAAKGAGGYLGAVSGDVNRDGDTDDLNVNGIIEAHVYSITQLSGAGSSAMIRLRNPWGTNDKHREELIKLGAVVLEEGEFELPFTTFAKMFGYIFLLGKAGMSELQNGSRGVNSPATPDRLAPTASLAVADESHEQLDEQLLEEEEIGSVDGEAYTEGDEEGDGEQCCDEEDCEGEDQQDGDQEQEEEGGDDAAYCGEGDEEYEEDEGEGQQQEEEDVCEPDAEEEYDAEY